MKQHQNRIKGIYFLVIVLAFAGSILSQGCSAESSGDKDKALLQAVKKEKLGRFKKLLESGANPNVVFGSDDWVMGLATVKGRMAYLKLAVEHGGDVNLLNPHNSYNRPIFHALLNHNDEAVRYLIDKGADLDARQCPGCSEDLRYTPVEMAVTLNEYELAYSMIKKKGKLTSFETDTLIYSIEHFPINLQSEANKWRMKVVEYLRSQGHTVKPWMKSRFE